MIKYLSGRVKRTPQDRLSADRYDYLDVKQAEPNLADPATSPPVPSGAQFQLVAVPGYPGKRYWVPVGGGLIPGAISIFDEGSLVSSASSITQLNFVGAAVTAQVSVQSPSGFPGIAATITVNPVTILDTPPINPRPGELWWESDTGDLYLYYEDADSSQWVTTNTGGRGDPGTNGDKGQKGEVGAQGLSGSEGDKGIKGQKGEVGDKGEKGSVEAQGNKGQKGEKGEVGDKGQKGEVGDKGQKGEVGDKGQKGEVGDKGQKGTDGLVGSHGDRAGLRYQYSHNTTMGDPGGGIFKYNNSSTLGSISAIAIDATTKEGTDVSDYIATWDDASNDTIKGHIIVKSNVHDDATYTIFEVTAVTDNTGWLQITVQNPVGNFPSNNEECVINFTRVGNKGEKGQKGEKGEKGEKGIEGEKGDKGQKGEVGQKGQKGEGEKGQKGEGDKGQKGEADKGQKGEVGDKGEKGEKGEKGQKGEVGEKGEKGEKGQKGEVGQKGQKGEGDKGQKGADNSTKGQKGEADKGQKGEVGDKGQKGEDNSTKGQKGEDNSTKGQKGEDNSTKGQKGEIGQKGATGADNSTKGQKGATGADNSTKGQKGEVGEKGTVGSTTKGQKGDTGADNSTKGQKGEVGQKGAAGAANANADEIYLTNTNDNSTAHAVVFADEGVGTSSGYKALQYDNQTFWFHPSENRMTVQNAYINNLSSGNGIVDIGQHIHVESGRIRPSSGNAGDKGIYWATDIGGGAGDSAWIRYFVESGENTRLEIGVSNDSDDDIQLTAGRVHLNTATTVLKATQPWVNNAYDLGTSSNRWANLYVNDLQLSNEAKEDTGGNDVDGTWGDYTIQEGENDLFLINNRNGKKYKFNLTEVD